MVQSDTPSGLFAMTRGAGGAVTIPGIWGHWQIFDNGAVGYGEDEPGPALQ